MSARTDTVLDRFPGHMAVRDPGKRIGAAVDALAGDLDVLTLQSGDVRRAHRIGDATTVRDVLGLVGAHGLTAAVLGPAVVRWRAAEQDDPTLAERLEEDDGWLGLQRRTLLDVIAVAVGGNGTPSALLAACAAYLGMGVNDTWSSSDRWWHLVFCQDRLADPDADAELDVIALEENPFRSADADPVEREHAARFLLLRGGMAEVDTTVVVTGVADRTERPMVVSLDAGHGLAYEGGVPEGSELRFLASGRVTLDETDVTGSAWEFHGAVFASATKELPDMDFCFADAAASADGRDARFVVSAPASELMTSDAGLPHGAAGVQPARLPIGQSHWACFVRLAHCGANAGQPAIPRTSAGTYDRAVFGDADSAGALHCGAASLAVGFEWEEREPFAVRVLLPRRLSSLDDDAGTLLREPLRRLLERHRPAGVRVGVEYADPRWTLGEGVLRDDVTHPLGTVLSGTELWSDESVSPGPA